MEKSIIQLGQAHTNYTITGHQWYWSYSYKNPALYADAGLLTNFTSSSGLQSTFSYDSFMVPINELVDTEKEDRSLPYRRLLEVSKRMYIPVHSTIQALITSDDVIHSWSVPSFAVKVDAIPGRINEAWIKPFLDGVYYGQCSEICGINHSFMPIVVEVMNNIPTRGQINDIRDLLKKINLKMM